MITLTSDFRWPYPAAMRGVLASRTSARLIDVTHRLPRQDVRAAAFWLREVLPYFPPAVHLVVVDPSVGTDRAVAVFAAGDHRFVGPDNGVMVPVARAIDPGFTAWELTDYDAASSTFHGRDVFAPLAADLHETKDWTPSALADVEPVDAIETVTFPSATREGDVILGEVLVVDSFGNVITNIPAQEIDPAFGDTLTVNDESVPFVRAYDAVAPGTPLATIGSHGNLELAVNRGRGTQAFDLSQADAIRVQFDRS